MKNTLPEILTTGTQSRSAAHSPGVQFRCHKCGTVKPVKTNGGTGYAVTSDDRLECYECCAETDRELMRSNDWITLYLSQSAPFRNPDVTNWPGTLRMPAFYFRTYRAAGFGGYHEMVSVRFHGPDGFVWSGRGPGLGMFIRCRRTKEKSLS